MTFAEILPGLLEGKKYRRQMFERTNGIMLTKWGIEWVGNTTGCANLLRSDYAATDWEEVGDASD